MLILPLHRPFTRRNFPFVTIALVLANVFVFFVLQSADDTATMRAVGYYGQSALPQIEFPAYREWLNTNGGKAALERAPLLDQAIAMRNPVAVVLLQADTTFLAALRADRVITPQNPQYATWKASRTEFDALWSKRFTDAHALTYDEVSPRRMLWAMFMHGGFGHLLGNMIFLVLLGLLVEGALGEGLFLAVYLLGGIGAAATSLILRWGDSGFLVGASGAIASLMGAYCVLWGMRKVRFFYWFFVVFDYVRAPAIVLLPMWLGWELFQLLFTSGSNVAFDAHAGGIVCGALLAYVVRRGGWERRDFLDEDEKAEQVKQGRNDYAQALGHLGKLEIPQARLLLERLDAAGPPSLDVRTALYRCARYANNLDELHRAARHALALTAQNPHKLKELFDDYRKASGGQVRIEPAQMLALVRAWLRIGVDGDAKMILTALATRHAALPGLPEACFDLARRSAEGSPAWRDQLAFVAERFPASPVAQKAKFLLGMV